MISYHIISIFYIILLKTFCSNFERIIIVLAFA